MRLKITHRTEYRYDVPVGYGLQRLRLVPLAGPTQAVISWNLTIEGAREETRFVDPFGNDTRLVSMEGAPHLVAVEASGVVETFDTAGITGQHQGFAPLWLFRRQTALTTPGPALQAFVEQMPGGEDIALLHAVVNMLADKVAYVPGSTTSATTAEEALTLGSGVCQDHAHIFLTIARMLGFPARYISGYLMMEAGSEQAASHAWAEVHVGSLGWVGFDVSNRISPDQRYVRIATGRDFRDASPVSGIRLGQAAEELAVRISVEQ
ncbi:MAG: transglutaminase family protein [Rhizobiaceae bacterium]|nr:transglutaminase family protein [Rhizobiaceae bacterium]